MELSPQNLSVLFEGYEMIFNEAMARAAVASHYEQIATIIPSSTRMTLLPFLKRTLQMSEWIDERVLQNLEIASTIIENRSFEGTLGIDLNDLKDDQYGVYNGVVAQLGEAARIWPDRVIFSLLKASATGQAITVGRNFVVNPAIGYDGVPFFSANHPQGPAGRPGAVQSNINSSGTGAYWFLIDGGGAMKPVMWQTREPFKFVRMNAVTDEQVFMQRRVRIGVDGRANAGVSLWQYAYASNTDLSNPSNYGAALAAAQSTLDDSGQPFGAFSGDPAKIYLCVPPSLYGVARQLLHGEFGAITGANGAVAGVPGTNEWRNSATLIMTPFLT